MIRKFLARWAEHRQLLREDLHEPLNVPDWPETDEPATPYIPQASPADVPSDAWPTIIRIDREHTAIRRELAELRASRLGARA